jgi:molybdopterin-guanine dinucleotide biosynthesis protein A
LSKAAIILAGGFSRRMGAEKWSLPFGRENMLERTARVLSEVVEEIVVVAREGQEIVVPPGCRLARDPAEGLGPLAGLAAGLAAIRADRAFLASCDLPFLRAELVNRLFHLAEGHHATVPDIGGRLMVTSAVYERELLAAAHTLLVADERRLSALVHAATSRIVSADDLRPADPALDSFRNINTPEDYEAALREAGFAP